MRSPSRARLFALLNYDKDTGLFHWKVAQGNRAAGALAGRVGGDGHRQINIDGVRYYAHLLAWLYVTGEWPETLIDHRDCNGDNNRFSNLRKASHQQNSANKPKNKNNTVGFKGVSRASKSNRFCAGIKVDGVRQHLGTFDTPEEASAAYEAAAKKNFGEFAHSHGEKS